MAINKSVGHGGANLKADVTTVVRLLNRNRHLLFPLPDLPEGGDYSDEIGDRIAVYQKRVVTGAATQDGRVDPGGTTLARLERNARDVPAADAGPLLFPFTVHPDAPWSTQGRAFRAFRAVDRLHAGCDLIFPPGVPIRAMADGKVIQPSYPFYSGTWALEVDHGTFVARYGEIGAGSVPAALDKAGAVVSRGERIASVGRLESGSSMLHLELYSGAETGKLTVRGNAPFQRRSDLLDPTAFLDSSTLDLRPAAPTAPAEGEEPSAPAPAARVAVTSQVDTRLRMRALPRADAEVLFSLAPETILAWRGTEAGGAYDFQGRRRDDWAEVEYQNRLGYVAAAYVAPVEGAAPATGGTAGGGAAGTGAAPGTGAAGVGATGAAALNAILFRHDPPGAADRTARQDGLPQRGLHGVAASETMAQTDLRRIEPLRDRFAEAGEETGLPPALLAAIASRESRGGAALRNGFGDGGHGYGIMQIDDRSWSADTSEGPSGLAHIKQAAGILALKLQGTETIRGLDDVLSLVTATSRYNGGRGFPAPSSDEGTTGGDYAADVWARARWYARKIDWS